MSTATLDAPPPRTVNVQNSGRHYLLPNGALSPSVTTILDAVGKPGLVGWSANTERALVLSAAADLWDSIQPDAPRMSSAAFVAALTNALGTTKAHTRELAKAAEIGNQVHHHIEWVLRKELGQTVATSPPPLSPKALVAYQRFVAWRETVSLVPQRIEQVVWSSTHGYAGTLDLLATITLHGVPCPAVLDWKSGKSIYPEALLQNAAYVAALAEMGHAPGPIHGVIVRLPKVESDPIPEIRIIPPGKQAALFAVFLHVKDLWEWLQEQDRARQDARTRPAATTVSNEAGLVTPGTPDVTGTIGSGFGTAVSERPVQGGAMGTGSVATDAGQPVGSDVPVGAKDGSLDTPGPALVAADEAARAQVLADLATAKAALARQPADDLWARIVLAHTGEWNVQTARRGALMELLATVRGLARKDPVAIARVKAILDRPVSTEPQVNTGAANADHTGHDTRGANRSAEHAGTQLGVTPVAGSADPGGVREVRSGRTEERRGSELDHATVQAVGAGSPLPGADLRERDAPRTGDAQGESGSRPIPIGDQRGEDRVSSGTLAHRPDERDARSAFGGAPAGPGVSGVSHMSSGPATGVQTQASASTQSRQNLEPSTSTPPTNTGPARTGPETRQETQAHNLTSPGVESTSTPDPSLAAVLVPDGDPREGLLTAIAEAKGQLERQPPEPIWAAIITATCDTTDLTKADAAVLNDLLILVKGLVAKDAQAIACVAGIIARSQG